MATKTIIPKPLFRSDRAYKAIRKMTNHIPARNEFGMSNSVWKQCLDRVLTSMAVKTGAYDWESGRVYLDKELGWRRASVIAKKEGTNKTWLVDVEQDRDGVTASSRRMY
ncbi:MAG: hypothetical protein GY811_05965 [Myxococcales bacterium]|nr:hypothetical protein [Myxococcales bacterium]